MISALVNTRTNKTQITRKKNFTNSTLFSFLSENLFFFNPKKAMFLIIFTVSVLSHLAICISANNVSSIQDVIENDSAETVRHSQYFPNNNFQSQFNNVRSSMQVHRPRIPQPPPGGHRQNYQGSRNHDGGDHYRMQYPENNENSASLSIEQSEPVSYSRVFYQSHPQQSSQQQSSPPEQVSRKFVEEFQERRPGERFHTKLYDDEQIYECVLASDPRKNHNKQAYRQPDMMSKHDAIPNYPQSSSNELYSDANESRGKMHPKYKHDPEYNNGRYKVTNSATEMHLNRDMLDEDNQINPKSNGNIEGLLVELRNSFGRLMCPDNPMRCLQNANMLSSPSSSSSSSAEQENINENDNGRMHQLMSHLMLSKKLIDILESDSRMNGKANLQKNSRFANYRRLDMIPFEESDSIQPNEDKFRSSNSLQNRASGKRKQNYHMK